MKLKVLVITSVLFVASGCAKTPHKSAPTQPQQPETEPEPAPTSVQSSKREITLTKYLQFKYQHYTCDELSERLLLIERQLPYMKEEVIQFFINDIEVIYWSAKEKNCRVIIQPFEETQEKADKELDSETAIGAALAGLTFLRCLDKMKSYRQPYWFAATVFVCATAVWISN